MSYYTIPTITSYEQRDSDWTSDFDEFVFKIEEGRGSRISYTEKQAYWLLFSASGGSFDIIVSVAGTSVSSDLLKDLNVAAIAYDGQTRPATDGGVDIWRKGLEGDDAAAQKASDTITLLNGASFFAGQTVTILKST